VARVARTVKLPGRLTRPYVEQRDPAGVRVLLLDPVLSHLPDSINAIAPTQRGHRDRATWFGRMGLPT
jgi:hypothetical protein